VTGSKGKSSVSSAIQWALKRHYELHPGTGQAYLGGNITISPLSFLDQIEKEDTVVLELSSWQLGDLRGRPILKPRVAVLTTIMSDHQDRYGSMEAYIADKRVIYQNQDQEDATVVGNDSWGQSFAAESAARKLVYSTSELPATIRGAWLDAQGTVLTRLPNGSIMELVPKQVLTPGRHQKQNLMMASLALSDLGIEAAELRTSMASFPGIEHRLEFFHESAGLRFYNDTAATIPEAAAAAIAAFEKPPIVVCGGTDKALDFTPLIKTAQKAKKLILLAGTGSLKIASLLDAAEIPYQGPFDVLDRAVESAKSLASPGDTIVLSPGCASFGMFLNEFDRGSKWKESVRRLCP